MEKKMNLNTALNLLVALNELDGHNRIANDAGTERVVFEPYVFSPETRMAIARNVAALQSEQKNFAAARDGLVRQYTGGSGSVPKEKAETFQAEVLKLLETECDDIKLRKLSEADLNLAVNPLPPSVIAALLPILEEQE